MLQIAAGAELGVPGAVENTLFDFVNLGLCTPEDAPVGYVKFTDGAPISARDMTAVFPYLDNPLPGARN